MPSYNKLYRFNTYHNDKKYKLTITGYDLLGNKMFNNIETFHKLGEFVSFGIPEFANYLYEYYIDGVKYNDIPHVKFCIDGDSKIDIKYSHVIYSHIDITDQDGKVVFCGPTYENMHDVTYCVRTGDINNPPKQTGMCKNIVNVPCLIESMQYTFKYPVVDGYYTVDEATSINIYPHIILHKKYWKIKTLAVNYYSEDGTFLYTIDDIDLSVDNMKANIYFHTVEVQDTEHYWDGEPNVPIKLTTSDNLYDIYLPHYRYVKARHNRIFDSSKIGSVNDIIEEYDIYNTNGTKQFRIGETAVTEVEHYNNYYVVTSDFDLTVTEDIDKTVDYTGYIDVDYYKYITFTIYPIEYVNMGTTEQPNYVMVSVGNPEIIDRCEQGKTYYYVPLNINGYIPRTELLVLNSTVDKVIHCLYERDDTEERELIEAINNLDADVIGYGKYDEAYIRIIQYNGVIRNVYFDDSNYLTSSNIRSKLLELSSYVEDGNKVNVGITQTNGILTNITVNETDIASAYILDKLEEYVGTLNNTTVIEHIEEKADNVVNTSNDYIDDYNYWVYF